MELWKILVLGALRLNCNWDYDKLKEIADNHITIRKMYRPYSPFENEYKYPLQTLRDNISLLTPEVLNNINIIVIKEGHKLFKKKSSKS